LLNHIDLTDLRFTSVLFPSRHNTNNDNNDDNKNGPCLESAYHHTTNPIFTKPPPHNPINPSLFPYNLNNDSEDDKCTMPTDNGSIFSIKKQDGTEVARLQYETEIEGNKVTISSVDLCLKREFVDSDHSDTTSYELSQTSFNPSYFVHYGDYIYTVTSTCTVPYEGPILSIYENRGTAPEDSAASCQFSVPFEDNQFQVGAVEMCLVTSILRAITDDDDIFFTL